jgi:pyrimidine-specific ribonucleoside hydrolase
MKSLFSLIFTLFFLIGCGSDNSDIYTNDVIIDTDMGNDDWMAITYLLKRDDINVVGITVDCTGLAECPTAAENLSKIVTLVSKKESRYKNLPIHYGNVPAQTLEYQYPQILRKNVTEFNKNLPGYEDMSADIAYNDGAGDFLANTLSLYGKSNRKLKIISIGTSTNFSEAIEIAKSKGELEIFKNGLSMYYKGGAVFGDVVNDEVTNQNIHGNINIPNLFDSNNTYAEWNIYPNAYAQENLTSNNIPMTYIPLNLTKNVPVTQESWQILDNMATSQSAKFISVVIYQFAAFQNWQGLEYWDPAVAFAALHPSSIDEIYYDTNVCVDTTQNQITHGATFTNVDNKCVDINESYSNANIYYHLKDVNDFYNDFMNTLNN